MPSLSELGGKAAVGLQTDDDFRFIRLLWEAPNSELGRDKKWVPLSKGGEYSPYFDDLHLALNWKNEGEEIKAFVEKHYNQWSRSVRTLTYTLGRASRILNGLQATLVHGHFLPTRSLASRDRGSSLNQMIYD